MYTFTNNSLSLSLSLALSLPLFSFLLPSLSLSHTHSGQSSAANSVTAFHWLQGYEKCRTGWDRFAKPQPGDENHSGHLIDLGAEKGALRMGFPETWPWSHIITPNSDGKTEIASKFWSVYMYIQTHKYNIMEIYMNVFWVVLCFLACLDHALNGFTLHSCYVIVSWP